MRLLVLAVLCLGGLAGVRGKKRGGGRALSREKPRPPASSMPGGRADAISRERENTWTKIRALYGKHNPNKLADIGKLTRKYGSKDLEEALLRALEEKYGAEGALHQWGFNAGRPH
jgi:hypothetical protein